MNFIKFPLPLADAKNFPQARILATSGVFLPQMFNRERYKHSQFFSGGIFTKNGRSALARVIKSIGLKKGETILLPEYFCPAMVEPFYWSGIKVKFYHLNENLTVDKKSFENLIHDDVKACLFVRFFGVSNDITDSLNLAKKFGLLAIEDCAHSFFSKKVEVDGFSFDASICSLNKFFPCSDGGMFRLNNKYHYKKEMGSREREKEVKAVIHFLKLDSYLSWLKSKFVKRNENIKTSSQLVESEYRYFNHLQKYIKCFKISEIIVNHSNYKKIVSQRKKNYDFLYSKLKSSKVGVPILERAKFDVPYVFPFLLNNEADFEYIRIKGVQILRWEEFYPVENSTIESYRRRLVQVPCHQNLSSEQLGYIVSVINKKI